MNKSITRTAVLVFLLLLLSLLMAVDRFFYKTGGHDPCGRIQIGDTRRKIQKNFNLSHELGSIWSMSSPCVDECTYSLNFSRLIFTNRLKDILIIATFGDADSIPNKKLHRLVAPYGIPLQKMEWHKLPDTAITWNSEKANVTLEYQRKTQFANPAEKVINKKSNTFTLTIQ